MENDASDVLTTHDPRLRSLDFFPTCREDFRVPLISRTNVNAKMFSRDEFRGFSSDLPPIVAGSLINVLRLRMDIFNRA